jgi:hypothetical protein
MELLSTDGSGFTDFVFTNLGGKNNGKFEWPLDAETHGHRPVVYRSTHVACSVWRGCYPNSAPGCNRN